MIAIVIIGLFARRVPALGAKIVIVFHILAYRLMKFVFDDLISLHFLHLYAILFFIEIGIMLVTGYLRPRHKDWTYHPQDIVDLKPWRYAVPCATSLMSCVIALYLLFSPIGLVNGLSTLFWPLIVLLLLVNVAVWWFGSLKKYPGLV